MILFLPAYYTQKVSRSGSLNRSEKFSLHRALSQAPGCCSYSGRGSKVSGHQSSYQDPGNPMSASGGPYHAQRPVPYRMSSARAAGSPWRRAGSRSHDPLSEGLLL
jgi:hypothetical protein